MPAPQQARLLSDVWPSVDAEDVQLNTREPSEGEDFQKAVHEASNLIADALKNRGEDPPKTAIARLFFAMEVPKAVAAACWSAALCSEEIRAEAALVVASLARSASTALVLVVQSNSTQKVNWCRSDAELVLRAARAMRSEGVLFAPALDLEKAEQDARRVMQTRLPPVFAAPALEAMQGTLLHRALPREQEELPLAVDDFLGKVQAARDACSETMWVDVRTLLEKETLSAAQGGEGADVVSALTRRSRRGLELAELFLLQCVEAVASVSGFDAIWCAAVSENVRTKFAPRFLVEGVSDTPEKEEEGEERKEDEVARRAAADFASGEIELEEALERLRVQA